MKRWILLIGFALFLACCVLAASSMALSVQPKGRSAPEADRHSTVILQPAATQLEYQNSNARVQG